MGETQKQILPKSILFLVGRWLFSLFAWIVFRTYTRLKFHYQAPLPSEPFIICSNHQSHLDAIILSHVSNRNFAKTAMIAAKDYWYDDSNRFYFSRLFFNIIPIDRQLDSEVFNIRRVSKIAREFAATGGKSIVILPEGTRSVNDTIKPFKKGVLLIAKHTQMPIVPVYIHDSRKIWPRGSWYMTPGKIMIEIGKAIPPEELQNASDPNMIREHIVVLSRRVR